MKEIIESAKRLIDENTTVESINALDNAIAKYEGRPSLENMLIQMKGALGLFFPIGLPPKGTCQYATPQCLRKCITKKSDRAKFCGYPLAPNRDFRKRVYQRFKRMDADSIFEQFSREIKESSVNILHWFASGDCPDYLVDKIIEVSKALSRDGDIYQCGFTRNRKVWRKMNGIMSVNIGLTVEHNNCYGEEGFIVIPSYSKGEIRLIKGRYNQATCGPRRWKSIDIERQTNCTECYENKEGCFHR